MTKATGPTLYSQRFRTGASGPGPGPGRNRRVSKLAVRVFNPPEPSIQVRFDEHLTTCLNWVGRQRVVQQVHL